MFGTNFPFLDNRPGTTTLYACHILVFCDASSFNLSPSCCAATNVHELSPFILREWPPMPLECLDLPPIQLRWLRITRWPATKRVTDDVDPTSSFGKLDLSQMSILVMGSVIEPSVFATTALLELSDPESIARKSSFMTLSWTRTLSCINPAYNSHTQPFAFPRCTTSPM